MVSSNYDGLVKGPYQDVKKDKSSTTQRPQQQTQSSQAKDVKNGAWGPIYKNKQNFINMHIC